MISSLGEWLKLVMLAGFVGGGLTYLLPDDRSRLKDYLRLIASLLLLLILLTPILKTLTGKTQPEFDDPTINIPSGETENLHKQALLREADKLFQARLQAIITQKFPNSTATAIPIYITAEEEVKLKCIQLYHGGKEGEEIAKHLRSLLETEVILCE